MKRPKSSPPSRAACWYGKVATKISEARVFCETEVGDQDYLQHYTGDCNS